MHPRLIDGTAKFQDAGVEFLQVLNGLAVTDNQVKIVKKQRYVITWNFMIHWHQCDQRLPLLYRIWPVPVKLYKN